MRTIKQSSSPRAFVWIASILFLSVVCAAVFVTVSVNHRANIAQQRLQQDVVMRGAAAIGLSFNTALKREWDGMHAVARNIEDATKAEIDDFMDAVAQGGGRVAWSGVADLDGTIISGSMRRREGDDVSARRWFREGLRKPNVGSVNSGTSPTPESRGENQAVLNLSTPIRGGPAGEVTGVLVYSLRMGWVQSFLEEARDLLDVGVVVQSREGITLVDTRAVAHPLPEAAVTQASLGRAAPGSFQMLDQAEGLYAFSPNFVNDNLPDFGWQVFAVLDRGSVIDVLPGLLRSAVIAVAIAALFVLAATIIVLRIMLRPLEKLSSTAALVADGEFDYPLETRSSFEAIMLSRALARIQGTLALNQHLHAHRANPSQMLLSGGATLQTFDPEETPNGPIRGPWMPKKAGGRS